MTSTDTTASAAKATTTKRTSSQPSASQSADQPERKKPFIVRRTSIHTGDGKYQVGEKVMLTAKEAKHFNKAECLAPFIEDDDADEDDN